MNLAVWVLALQALPSQALLEPLPDLPDSPGLLDPSGLTPEASQAEEVPGSLSISPISEEFAMGPGAEALDALGHALVVAPGLIDFEDTDRGEEVTLPVSLAPGRELEMFHDPKTGFTLVDDEATLPLQDPVGKELGVFHLALDNFSAEGSKARARVKEVQLVTSEVQEDFSRRDSEVGDVEVQLAIDLAELPEGAELRVDPELEVDAREQGLFREAAAREGLAVKDFAYQVNVDKKNLVPTGATITLKVDPKWTAAQGGAEKVRILRDDEQGNVQVLPTFYTGRDAEGHDVYVAPSSGLSVFSLVAVEGSSAQPQSRPSSPPYGLLGLAAAVGIGVGLALGFAGRPPGGGMNPWLRIAMKSSGELKDVEQTPRRQDRG